MYKRGINSYCNAGFTLLELLVVVAIVGILAAVAIPVFGDYREKASVAATVSEMRSFESAFYAYYAEHGDWPNDSHRTLPTGMEKYLNQAFWDNETPIGGFYNWDGPDSYAYAGLSIFSYDGDAELIDLMDQMLDDGNTGIGRFRYGSNGRPTLIIEE